MSDPQAAIEVRARSLGEILDDGWRLFLQDLPPLALLSWLFNVPWAAALLWAFTRPALQYGWWWATLTAGLFFLGGVGSGACQELLRQRAAGRRASVGDCLKSAFATMPQHLGVRVLAWTLLIVAIVLTYQGVLAADRVMAKILSCFFLSIFSIVPGLIVWNMFIPAHALLAAHGGTIGSASRASRREVGRQAGKALSLFLVRVIIFLVAMINLVALTQWGMGVAESVLGLELSFLRQFLGVGNAAFMLGLTLLTMLLLAPYFEVVHYLFHLDARARYEGLDLWYRVQRQFPAPLKATAAGIALAMILLCPLGAAYAQQVPPRAVTPPPKAPAEIAEADIVHVYNQAWKIRYEGAFNSRDWHDRLVTLSLAPQVDRLPPQVRKWIETAARRIFDPAQKVEVSEETARVAMKELLESLYAMLQSVRKADRYPDKDLVKEKAGAEPGRPQPRPTKPDPPEDPPPPPNPPPQGNNPPPGGAGFNPGPRAAPSVPIGAGATGLMWGIIIVCIGGAVAVVAAVSYKAWKNREKKPEPKVQPQAHPEADAIEQLLSEPVKGSNPWMEADQLAQRGEPTEAIRMLYIKLLVLLHRANLIRYERTRTNGEYVRMLRSRPEIQKPFRQLTQIFELKWYGKRPCEVNEYYACRDLADLIHGESSRHG